MPLKPYTGGQRRGTAHGERGIAHPEATSVPIEEVSDIVYFPHFWEFAAMAVYALAIVWLGWLVRQRWNRQGESVPIPVAGLLWLAMFGLYCVMPFTFYATMAPPPPPVMDIFDPSPLLNYTPQPDRRLTILYWCLLIWILPLSYYTSMLVNSLAVRSVDRIGPFSAHIDEPSEFAAARKLALRGDIDGAVAMYRSYTDDPANALFEAARLLRSVDRFAEAAALFQEIATRFYGKARVWAEAVYQVAKLQEAHLNAPDAAMANYRALLDRAPETRFGEMAMTDLSRMQVFQQDLSADEDAVLPTEVLLKAADEAKRVIEAEHQRYANAEATVAEADPFFGLRQRAAARYDEGEEAASDAVAKPAKKAAAKKPAASKAKAAAKPAPKKPSAPRKKQA
jgi:hypothetical protein